ncbi:MAG TPA: ABC transporter substrate-binding protein [Roseomonas sp.]|jgi:peptide/nickel transport system substrate-binding protein
MRIAAALLAVLLAAAPAVRAQAPDQVLRVVLANDLTSIDPVQSTAAFVRNHGFLIYDQLFALDSHGVARPQMVRTHEISSDGLSHRFTLRDGLLFDDGAPVRAADAVQSIRRWAERDTVGRTLAAATAALEVVDERSFVLRLSRPFGLVAEALARPTANALFVMPERVARTPATEQITDTTGSGPFLFRRADWRIGDRAVYRRNPLYRPRAEAPDGLAGGKQALVDRIEWIAMPDAATTAAALQQGEIDFWEQVSADLVPVLERNRALTVGPINAVGSMIWLRINHTQPPFDDPRARRALLHLVNQQDVLDAIGIRPADQRPYCPAYFMCGTPLETDAGAEGLRAIDIPRAQALLREAGYANQRVLFMNPADTPINNAATLVLADAFARAGLNMDVPALDWGTLTQRRNRREPVEQGGWSLFVTVANALDAENPLSNVYLAAPGAAAPAGWPEDAELEALRRAWWEESDPAKRTALLARVQARAYQVLPYINAGQFRTMAAWRRTLQGIRPTAIPVFWGVSKRS